MDQPCIILIGLMLMWVYHTQSGKYRIVEKWGMSYHDVVVKKELYRVFTSVVLHVDLWHLVFNLINLWNLRVNMQPWEFAFNTIVLVILSGLCELILVHSGTNLLYDRSIGFSGVLFAWMAFAAVGTTGSSPYYVLGLFETPGRIHPWSALILDIVTVHLVYKDASLYGHLGGVMAGVLFHVLF